MVENQERSQENDENNQDRTRPGGFESLWGRQQPGHNLHPWCGHEQGGLRKTGRSL